MSVKKVLARSKQCAECKKVYRLDFFRTIITGNVFTNFWADISKLMMLLTGLFFTIQCIRSFIHARRTGKTES